MQPAMPDNGVGNQLGGPDAKMDALIARLDRIAAVAEKSSDSIYGRRLNTVDFANPAPIGLFSFGIALALYMTSQAHISEASAKFVAFPIGIFLGGVSLVITGFLELYRHNGLGAVSFTTYGFFFISVGVYGTIKAAGIYFLDSPKGEEALTALMAIASGVYLVVSLACNVALPMLFGMLTVMFALLSAGTQHSVTAKVAGWWGVVTSALAFYVGAATLFRDLWGREVLPQGFTKAYLEAEKIMRPRIVVHSGTHKGFEDKKEHTHGDEAV